MKKLNLLETSKAIMFLLIGAGIFMFGAASFFNNPVKADHVANQLSTGKYQISTTGFELNGKAIYNVIVWDSETGKSKIYGFTSEGKMILTGFQLPSSPLY